MPKQTLFSNPIARLVYPSASQTHDEGAHPSHLPPSFVMAFINPSPLPVLPHSQHNSRLSVSFAPRPVPTTRRRLTHRHHQPRCVSSSGAAGVPADAPRPFQGPSPPPTPPPSVLDAIRPTPEQLSAAKEQKLASQSTSSMNFTSEEQKKPSVSSKTAALSATSNADSNLSPQNFVANVELKGDGAVNQHDEIAASWAKKGTTNAIMRTLEVWSFFFTVVKNEMRNRKLTDRVALQAARRESARLLKDGLLKLGPTFIKLGQLLSTRVDIVPKEYIDELSILQDRVPGFSGKQAMDVIENELGRPLFEIFDRFEETPIAAASLGQVHRGMVDGQPVAVKIQRAGLRELFDVDLKNLKLLAKLLDKLDPKTDGAKRNWVQIYDESAKLLYEEIDYVREGRNADLFRSNFESVPWVKVPGIYWDLTSERVLTMEYVPGIKINDYDAIERAGIDRNLLAQRSAESYLTQLLRHGYFHTDPHCGNLAVDSVAGGRLIYYDFGMMSTFEPNIKKGLVDVVFGLYEGSVNEICNAMVLMGVLSNSADRVTVEKVGRYFLELFRGNLAANNKPKTKEEKRKEMLGRLDAIGEDLLAVSEDECFNFPPVFTFVFRAFTTLEGIGKGLNPSYDLTIIAGPYLKELIDLRDGSATVTAIKTFRKRVGWRAKDLSAVISQPRKTAYIEETLRRMESGDLKLRVRVLESERNFKRVSLMQDNIAFALAAASCANMALVLTTAAQKFALQARLLWLLALIFFVRLAIGLIKSRALEARLRKYVRNGN